MKKLLLTGLLLTLSSQAFATLVVTYNTLPSGKCEIIVTLNGVNGSAVSDAPCPAKSVKASTDVLAKTKQGPGSVRASKAEAAKIAAELQAKYVPVK